MNEAQQATGRHLSQLRGSQGLTQKELAAKSGVTERSISSFENGDTWPRAGTRAKLEEALSLRQGYLSEFADGATPNRGENEFERFVERLAEGKMDEFGVLLRKMSRDMDPTDPESVDALIEQVKGIAAALRALTEFREMVRIGEEQNRDMKFRAVFNEGKFDHIETEAILDSEAEEKAGEDNASTPLTQAGVSPADDGLGAFGHRDRGDLDHEAVNDGAGENVHELFTPPPPAEKTVAWETGNRGRKLRQQQDEDAEGSQVSEDGEE